jgi:signal transduction histidine kinase/tetratricopeptide (TPR) repeat protein
MPKKLATEVDELLNDAHKWPGADGYKKILKLLERCLATGDNYLIGKVYLLAAERVFVELNEPFKGLELADLAREYIPANPTDEFYIRLNLMYGKMYGYIGRKNESLHYMYNVSKLIDNLTERSRNIPFYEILANNHIGGVLNRVGLFSVANEFLEKGFTTAEELKEDGYYLSYKIMNGLRFSVQKKYEQALNEYAVVIDQNKKFYKQLLVEAYYGTASIFIIQKKYDEALKMLDKEAELRREFAYHERSYFFHTGQRAKAYYFKGEVQKGDEMVREMDRLYKAHTGFYEPEAVHKIYCEVLYAKGDYEAFAHKVSGHGLPSISIAEVESIVEVVFKWKQYEQADLANESQALRELNKQLNDDLSQLELSNRDLKKYASVASHDLREPLRAVSTYMQILYDKLKGKLNDIERKMMAFALEGAKRMDDIIVRLLNSARSQQIDVKAVNLNNIVEQVKMNLAKLIQDNNGEVRASELPVVMADEIQMIQLFQNLISNGLKYNVNKTPTVKISCRKDKKGITLSFADNGIGIKESDRKKVFAMFQRIKNETNEEGTGIGLSTCLNIVTRNKGTIEIQSNKPSGSVFLVSMPHN